MNICVLGKYPPIEGGVSSQTFWLARGLASRGNRVHVVTNADEVEPVFRMSLAHEDARDYQAEFSNGGHVRVYRPLGYSRRAMLYIPEANPFVTKLASVATDVIRQQNCDVVVAYYYEPYAVAGYLASRWTSRPLIVKHAGSDLDRLLRIPDLATTYKEILRAAEAIITKPRFMPRFIGLGASRERLETDIPYGIPTESFRPTAVPMDIARAAIAPSERNAVPRARPFDPTLPTVGIYGKIGAQKGTFDLVAALGLLVRQGAKLNFAAMIGEGQAESLGRAVHQAGLEETTYILPFLPNWRVPGFLRACSLVCFLERAFEIAIHAPIIPREVLASGTCLVLSREIATNQRYREQLRPGENVILVEDPRDHTALANVLRPLLSDHLRLAQIGEQGAQLSTTIERYESYIDGWEQLLARVSNKRPEALLAPRPRVLADIEASMPGLLATLRRLRSQLVEEYVPLHTAGTPHELVEHFCAFVIDKLARESQADSKQLLELTRYARARARTTREPVASTGFPVQDRLISGQVTQATVWELRPVRSQALWIESFEYDVASARSDVEPASLPRDPCTLLFHRSVNLVFHELRIDASMGLLIEACDGTRTTAEVANLVHSHAGSSSDLRAVLRALEWLYREGMIVFGEHRDEWGWTGGVRGTLPCSSLMTHEGLVRGKRAVLHNRRYVYDRAVDDYEAVRPSYPAALIDDVIALAGVSPGACVLEVGAGTGQATRLLAARGLSVTAVEVGSALAAATRVAVPGARVVNARFEELALPRIFQLVVSATAWHWMDPAHAYARAHDALLPSGALAVFWNVHVRGDDDIGFFEATQDLYEAAGMRRTRLWPDRHDSQDRTASLVASGHFGDVVRRRYPWRAEYDARTYARLLGTYSDHLTLADDVRTRLLEGVARLIETRFGGKITKHYLADLYVARARDLTRS